MRGQQERKGGGLMMIISKEHQDIVLNPVETTSKDSLIMKGNLKSFKVTIILVYLSVIRNEVEKNNNQSVLKEIRRGIHDSSEDYLIFIIGDFNAHLGIIGNKKSVMEYIHGEEENKKVPLILYL